MKHMKLDKKLRHKEMLSLQEDDTTDYFALVMKQKKQEKIYAVVIAVLSVLSLVGFYIGINTLIKLGTTWAYLIVGIIAIPLVLILGGVMFLIFKKETDTQKKDKELTFVSINFLLFVFIGVCMAVFHLIKKGTILTYSISALIVCVVLYMVFKAVKGRMENNSN